MSPKSNIPMRAALIALAGCTAASFLAAPAAAQSSDPAQAKREQAIQAIMARHHLLPRIKGAGVTPSGQLALAPPPQPPPDTAAGPSTPTPIFTVPSELPLPANAVPQLYYPFIDNVTCTSAGNCVVVGVYADATTSGHPLIVTEKDGVWQAAEAALPANAAPETSTPYSQYGEIYTVTCFSAGNCVAVGAYFATDNPGALSDMILTETNGVWAKAIELNPPLKLPTNAAAIPNVYFNDAPYCTRVGDCLWTGGYTDVNGNPQSMVVSETKGVWGPVVEITLPANAAPNPFAGPENDFANGPEFGQLNCFSHGNCVGGGEYTDSNYNDQFMIATETRGVWNQAIELTLPANAGIPGTPGSTSAFMNGLACFSPGNCITSGGYNDSTTSQQAVVFSETRGVWGQGFELTLPANAATAPGAQSAYLNGLTCTSRGNCIAYSAYNDLDGNGEPLVIIESGGVWAQGIEPPLPANAATAAGTQNANIQGASCTSPGVCVAVGQYADTNGNWQPMAYTTAPARHRR